MVVSVPCSSDREHAQALRRSLRSLTHVRTQPLDVNHAQRCWLHRQRLFVEKTDISNISVFSRRPSTITQAAPICAIVRDHSFPAAAAAAWYVRARKTLRKAHSFPAAAAAAW